MRLLEQMTRITPRRRTILQCSQSFFTDARTFILKFSSSRSKSAPATNHRASTAVSHVRRTQTGDGFVAPGPPQSQQTVTVGQLHAIRPVRQRLGHDTFNLEGICSGHVKISGSPSVIRTVCSKWADSEPSCVTTVQPSFKTFTPGWRAAFTIGSMSDRHRPGATAGLHLLST